MDATNRTAALLSALALVVVSGTAEAQDTGSTPKMVERVLVDNERVKVAENIFAPGAESPSIKRPYRVVRALKGGKFQRIYPDGKKESGEYQTGQVGAFGATPAYIFKNAGDSELVLYVVYIKN
ncbi:cupin domain-containing protein [Caballeronia grimmiae]|uniref:hypothetical protein n=1 Tax=Caballeronia grimmiae TaxID=1071679 RepID=UPI0038B85B86